MCKYNDREREDLAERIKFNLDRKELLLDQHRKFKQNALQRMQCLKGQIAKFETLRV